MSILRFRPKHVFWSGAIALWLVLLAAGLTIMLRYSATPGRAAEHTQWFDGAGVVRASDRPTLLLFAHPHCPCSRASIGELDKIVAHSQSNLSVQVFFFRPQSETREWMESDLWRSARAIPGVDVHEDLDNSIARQFGVFTSGQTLLFDRAGKLIFRGGITAARGHAGDNAGRSSILAFVQGGSTSVNATPVFGCSLRGEQ